MSITWFNITSKYNNQKIIYSSDNGNNYKTITIPEGIWDFDKLNSYINSQINDNNPINITFDRNTLYTTIKIKENYSLDLSRSNFNNLLGFKKIIKFWYSSRIKNTKSK